ncbi:50S ribosomal protein L33 [Candidatus Phytoplasma mali]|uniref:Large ribosomal subunit protein bL33 n=1 Tax=Phytoplasma mali (strain AT) TaxID=482235 RepID=B3QZG3_PHYMT|nr:50S ribosomal protein L33 [Candidatus Phytoplasma mali]CAP18570.1 50S ribosomal protein L33 [Candidatus Phytoplasma mali]
MVKKNILICSICLNRNYNTKTNSIYISKRLILKKYCPNCNRHTLHKENQ